MSSVDKFPDWSIFRERETLAPVSELLSPTSEITATLRSTNRTLSRTQQALQDIEQSSFTELAQLAVLVTQLGTLIERNAEVFAASAEQQPTKSLSRVYKSLQIIQNQMLDSLKKAGLEVEIPLYKTYAEVAEYVEIEQWQHLQNLSEETVIDVLEPVIRRGALLHTGRVIMGAPLTTAASDEQDGTAPCEQMPARDKKEEPANE